MEEIKGLINNFQARMQLATEQISEIYNEVNNRKLLHTYDRIKLYSILQNCQRNMKFLEEINK